MMVDVSWFFWENDEGHDGVDECDVENDEGEWGRRWKKTELITCCWLTVR